MSTAATEAPELAELISVKQAAHMLKNRSLKTMYRLVESGRLPAWRILGRLHVREADVLALVQPVEPKRLPAPAEPLMTKAQKKALEKWRQEVRARSRI